MRLDARIVVLDDEPLVRLMICSALEQAGATVVDAATCAEALELLHQTELDAAVFDYRLPDGDGLALAARMQREGQTIPVILLSGESHDIRAAAEEAPLVTEVLSKPPDNEALVQAVFSAVGANAAVEVAQVGRYTCRPIRVGEDPATWADADWLAVEVTELNGERPDAACLEFLARFRSSTVIVGADEPLRAWFEARLPHAEFAEDSDELAALSRRPSRPSERALLLESVFQGGADDE